MQNETAWCAHKSEQRPQGTQLWRRGAAHVAHAQAAGAHGARGGGGAQGLRARATHIWPAIVASTRSAP